MAKDLFLGVGIGVVGAAAFKAAVGGSIRRIDQLGGEISNLQARARRIQAVRDLAPQIGRTAAAAQAAREGATQLGRALSETAQPTRKLRREFEAARAEARRPSDRTRT